MVRRSSSLGIAVVVSIAIGCSGPPPASSLRSADPASSSADVPDREHAQARAALERWAAAKAASGGNVAIVGELTGQVGDWEAAVGENNKSALMAGLVRIAAEIPSDEPTPGEVLWADGTSASVPLLSAAGAVDAIRSAMSGASCDGCRALEITSARLALGDVTTTRGPASVPMWQFTVQGTRVIVTRVALAAPVVAEPPPWDPNDAPEGLSIDGAVGLPTDAVLTVSFVGAPKRGTERCGADYTAEGVESDLAVVVIVVEQRNPVPAACALAGAVRTATVQLSRPLGGRAVLEVKEGRPVQVSSP